MQIKEIINEAEFNEFIQQILTEGKFSDERVRNALSKIEKGISVEKDGTYTKIHKVTGEKVSPKVKWSKDTYNELAKKSTVIRKGLLLGAMKGTTDSETRKRIADGLTELKANITKLRSYKNRIDKFAPAAMKKTYELENLKIRAPLTKKVEKEEREASRKKKAETGAKIQRKVGWEKMVKGRLNKNKSQSLNW